MAKWIKSNRDDYAYKLSFGKFSCFVFYECNGWRGEVNYNGESLFASKILKIQKKAMDKCEDELWKQYKSLKKHFGD